MVIATTLHRQDGGQGKLEALLVNSDGAWLAAVPHLGEGLPKGAGDLFAALFLSQILKGKPADKALLFGMAGTYTLLRDALENQAPEMRLEALQDGLLSPQITPDIQRVR
jgi:pyridoxal/pyridoxine/pyridoxamine kinase